MSLGAAAALRVCGSFLKFLAQIANTFADVFEGLGDPELHHAVVIIIAYLLFTERISKAVFCLLLFSLIDLWNREITILTTTPLPSPVRPEIA